ncbi:uncharacterized protein GBIM_04819 [Gryllus bimaculatus]|nr:uncharacterized protein GBIM_04819 [Gryllus bimaculatus]
MPRPLVLVAGAYILICCGWIDALISDPAVVCPALSEPTRTIKCNLNGTQVDCKKSMVPGTEAVVQCELLYTHIKQLSRFFIRCQPNGTWSGEITPCEPKCGETNPSTRVVVSLRGYHYWWYLSKKTKESSFDIPWHAGVYLKYEGKNIFICGGTIISERVIVTAAHCFWDVSSSQQKDQKLFKIAAGKIYHDWYSDELYAQKREIDKIILHPRFRGDALNWMADISLVKLREPLIMTFAIRPICLDFDKQFQTLFTPGKMGVVVGWGGNVNKTRREKLRQLNLPYVKFEECEKAVPQSFLAFLTNDKFCAGYLNGEFNLFCRASKIAKLQLLKVQVYALETMAVGMQRNLGMENGT